jgi:hypothetical protein
MRNQRRKKKTEKRDSFSSFLTFFSSLRLNQKQE